MGLISAIKKKEDLTVVVFCVLQYLFTVHSVGIVNKPADFDISTK